MRIPLNEYVSLVPTFAGLEVSPIRLSGGDALSFQTSVVDFQGRSLGTGLGKVKEFSILKALNESVERNIFSNVRQCQFRSAEFLIDEHPSSCGFAVAQKKNFARDIAVAEAVERWVRSKWIDENYFIEESELDNVRTCNLLKWSFEHFRKIRVFEKKLSIVLDCRARQANSIIVVAYAKNGAFVGSNTKLDLEADFDHALMEAWRHLRLATSEAKHFEEEKRPIVFFSENFEEADKQIMRANKKNWPSPKLRIVREVPLSTPNFHCVRAICDDYIGWHINDGTRFVY